MRVLVAGGTGFVGRHVVEALLRDGHEVAVLTRDPGRADLRGGRVRAFAGDVTRPETLPPAVDGIQVVVHAVQFPNHPVQRPSRGWTYENVDARGAAAMAAAAQSAGVRRFVYFSGAGLRPDAREPWFRAKMAAEKAIRESGIEYVFLRPSWIYGPGDRSMSRFAAFARALPFVPVIGDGRTRLQPIWVGDVAEVAARAARLPEAAHRAFELGGPQALTMDEILRTLLGVLGKEKMLLHHPKWLVKCAAWFMGVLPNPPLSPEAVDFVTMDVRVDPAEAERVFGMKFLSLEEGLRRYL